jgi:hypothetical protein
MLTTRSVTFLALANFLTGAALLAPIITSSPAHLPGFGQAGLVPKFLPLLLCASAAFGLALWFRKAPRTLRWLALSAALLALLTFALDAIGGLTWAVLPVLSLALAMIYAARSVRSDLAQASPEHGQRNLVWAELGYGVGTATGIVLWDAGLVALGNFSDALLFVAGLSGTMALLDWAVLRGLVPYAAPQDEAGVPDQFAGDAAAARQVVLRLAALVPLLAVGVQGAVMRQTDRFNDFFEYMSFDFGTVLAGLFLARSAIVLSGQALAPRGYEEQGRALPLLPWILACALSMLLGFGFAAAGFKMLECCAYAVAGLLFEGMWTVLLDVVGKIAGRPGIDMKGVVQSTIGAAAFATTLVYVAMTVLALDPLWVTLVAMGTALGLGAVPMSYRRPFPA